MHAAGPMHLALALSELERTAAESAKLRANLEGS
jgi:hypothetical protein